MIRIPLRALIPMSALAAALVVGAADGQTPPQSAASSEVAAPPAPAASPQAESSAPAKADAGKAAAGKTVSGVTVNGTRPLKKCDDRDTACIVAVAMQLKTLYPEKFHIWCNQQQDQANWSNLVAADLLDDPNHPGHENRGGEFRVPPAIKMACAPDKKK
jgi:hypothetical protein